MAVLPAPLRVPSQRPVAPSATSVTSAVKCDNEMIPGSVHRSPDIYLIAEKTAENLS